MPRRLRRDARGATAVEFALIAAALMGLILGIVQVGAALMARAEVSHALGQAVRVVYVNPDVTRAELEAVLAERLAGGRASEFEVAVETIEGVRALRVVVRFPVRIVVPFLPIGPLTLQVETLTPAVAPQG